MQNIGQYSKMIVAFIIPFLSLMGFSVQVTDDGSGVTILMPEMTEAALIFGMSAVSAFGTYAVPNAKKSDVLD